ncbi:MAG: hypothetical protein HUN04_16585 [Desulfobacter sp.]|nr:MAG: hypothetical protein HUN04_16585 [Desulfobacter sp.]
MPFFDDLISDNKRRLTDAPIPGERAFLPLISPDRPGESAETAPAAAPFPPSIAHAGTGTPKSPSLPRPFRTQTGTFPHATSVTPDTVNAQAPPAPAQEKPRPPRRQQATPESSPRPMPDTPVQMMPPGHHIQAEPADPGTPRTRAGQPPEATVPPPADAPGIIIHAFGNEHGPTAPSSPPAPQERVRSHGEAPSSPDSSRRSPGKQSPGDQTPPPVPGEQAFSGPAPAAPAKMAAPPKGIPGPQPDSPIIRDSRPVPMPQPRVTINHVNIILTTEAPAPARPPVQTRHNPRLSRSVYKGGL